MHVDSADAYIVLARDLANSTGVAPATVVSEMGPDGDAEHSIGLSSQEASHRLLRDGPNALPQHERRRWPRLLLDVLREPMLALLIGAALLYTVLGERHDAIILSLSVVLVVALTLYQELRAEHALQALRELSSPRANVVRDGVMGSISSAELVVGDAIMLAEGDRVPADARLITADDLFLDESLLTGESVPVGRQAQKGESASLIRAGTLVVRGRATAEVTATGPRTELGRIGATLSTTADEITPLQREIRRLVGWFAVVGIISCLFLALLYFASHGDALQALLAGVTLAMANIPEEFPVVLTVFLALGAWRMARHRVLVRRPPAIEALGAVTVLCTDKTGTLTWNRMSLANLCVEEEIAYEDGERLDQASEALLRCANLAGDSEGYDPMDRAIRVAAECLPTGSPTGETGEWLRRYPVKPALPVYANAWRGAHAMDVYLTCKGAPETVAGLCGLSPEASGRMLSQAAAMAARGLRVLAAADAMLPDHGVAPPDAIGGIRFCWRGLLGLADPLRPEVPAAVAEARAAGVRVIMMTGDHLETARAIAIAANIDAHPEAVIGSELEDIDGKHLQSLLAQADVFARVRPEHKLRLVRALKAQGHVVAMTGDGVNDAPALAAAHVGIAMGGRGTDVAREAASIILLDDDFASIVRAIRMGRSIYDNLRRAAGYVIAVHVPITGLAILPLLFGFPLILMPLHVVLLEMMIDPASAIVLEREPAAADLMQRPPRPAGARLISLRIFLSSLLRGVVVLAAVVAVYALAHAMGLQSRQSACLAFVALVVGNVSLIILHRTRQTGKWRIMSRNPVFLPFTAAVLLVMAAVAMLEGPASWFGFLPVTPLQALFAALVPTLALLIVRGCSAMRNRYR